MGVIEHSDVIENAVTLGGGGGDLTPPVTLTGTDPTTTPLTVAEATGQSIASFRVIADAGELFHVGSAASQATLQLWDAVSDDWSVVLNIAHRLLAGTDPAANIGVSLQLSLPAADDAIYAGGLTAVWTDPTAQSSYLVLNCYSAGHSYIAPLTLRPEGLEIPLITAPSGAPPAGFIWLYADTADNHLKKKLPAGTVVDLG